MYCCAESLIYKWDLEQKAVLEKYDAPGSMSNYYLWMVLRSDDKMIYANGGGAEIALIETDKDGSQ